MKKDLAALGFWLGMASSLAQITLWLGLVYQERLYPAQITAETWLVNARMIGLALAGLLAARFSSPLPMLAVFLASFYPVGLYVSGVPSVFRWIGITDLSYLAAGLLLLANRCKTPRAKAREMENSYGIE